LEDSGRAAHEAGAEGGGAGVDVATEEDLVGGGGGAGEGGEDGVVAAGGADFDALEGGDELAL